MNEKETTNSKNNIKGGIAAFINALAYILLSLGCIMGVFILSDSRNVGIIVILSSLTTCAILLGIYEIIISNRAIFVELRKINENNQNNN